MLRKLLICSLLLAPLTGICQQNKQPAPAPVVAERTDYREINAPLPPFRVVTPDGKMITPENMKNDANLLVMFFNPTCEHCEDMTLEMEKHIYLFKKTKVLLVAGSNMASSLGDFIKALKVDQYPTLQPSLDSSKFIDKTFNYNGLPQINVYDHDRKLIRTFNSITTIDSLKAYIE